jgi:hypothetical protein
MDEEDIPRDYGWCRSRREISCGAAFPSLTNDPDGASWTAARIEKLLDNYFTEHTRIRLDPVESK